MMACIAATEGGHFDMNAIDYITGILSYGASVFIISRLIYLIDCLISIAQRNNLKKTIKKYKDSSFDNFYEIYTTKNKEFCFKYKNYFVLFVHESKYSKYIISKYMDEKTVNYHAKHCLRQYRCKSPEKAIDNFTIDGQSLEQIWREIEYV